MEIPERGGERERKKRRNHERDGKKNEADTFDAIRRWAPHVECIEHFRQ